MRKAADIIARLLDRATADNAELYGSFFRGWQRVAGEQIAAHSNVTDVRNGMVVVEADHPGWIQLIQLHEERILLELRREYPSLKIHGLRLQLPREGRGAKAFGATEEVAGRPVGVTGETARPAAAGAPEPRRSDSDEAGRAEIAEALRRLSKAIEDRGTEGS